MSGVHERADWQNPDRDLRDRLHRLLYPEHFDHETAHEWSGSDLMPIIGSMVVDDLPTVAPVPSDTVMVLYSALERIDQALPGSRDSGIGWEHRVADDAVAIINETKQSGQ